MCANARSFDRAATVGQDDQPWTPEVSPNKRYHIPCLNRPRLKYLGSNRVMEWYLRNSFQKNAFSEIFLVVWGFPEVHS
jgi:hypothetical protein